MTADAHAVPIGTPERPTAASTGDAPAGSVAQSPATRELITGGVLLTLATLAASASNYVFQVLAGRILGPSDYGLLSSIFTVLAIVTISTSSIQAACAKDVAVGVEGHRPGSRLRDDPIIRAVTLLGIAGTAVVVLASPAIAHFLGTSSGDVIAFAFLLPSVGLAAVAFGRLQGQERFRAYAALGFGLAFGKLVLGVSALAIGLGVAGGIAILAVVSGIGAIWGCWHTRDAGPTAIAAVRGDTLRALLAFGFFSAMISLDIPLARHLFDGVRAGRYAAASVIGHGVIWLPEVVALVAFPEMVKARAHHRDERLLLVRSAFLALGMCLVGTLFLALAGNPLFNLFYGSKYSGAAHLSWRIGLATAPFAVANVFLYDHLAGRRARFVVLTGMCAAVEVAGLFLVHGSDAGFVAVIGASGTLLTIVLIPWQRFRRSPGAQPTASLRPATQTPPQASRRAGRLSRTRA